MNKLPLLNYKPHDFQQRSISNVQHWYENESESRYYLLASPTGTGKSIIELALQIATYPASWLITPRIEIIKDLLCKLEVSYGAGNVSSLVIKKALDYQITTPIRFKNMLMQGKIEHEPKLLMFDEGHHAEADTYKQIIECMPDTCKFVAFTASPYRGTPKGTAQFYRQWGIPNWAITYPAAMQQGYLSMPICKTIGLMDDDTIELQNGEFSINRLTSLVTNKLEHGLKQTEEMGLWGENGSPKRPTIIGVPSSECMPYLSGMAERMGLRIENITDETSYKERQIKFDLCKESKIALCHINVVSEGIDLPIRQYIDFASTMSPNAFIQRFGRNTRPIAKGELAPVYICFNRNLERHGYLLEGCLPISAFTESQTAFNGPSKRGAMRAFGLESLGRLQGFELKLIDGLTVTCYAISSMDGTRCNRYMVLLHPRFAQPIWFKKNDEHKRVSETQVEKSYGKWETCKDIPNELSGFKSDSPYQLTEGQEKAWYGEHGAKKHGIEPDQKIDNKRIQLFFALRDAKAKLA